MDLHDRLIKQGKEEEKKKRHYFSDDDEEETMTYKERSQLTNLNDRGKVFDRFDANSLNNQESIFNKNAIFRTNK